ncbi:MAG: hypothetical protein J7521_20785 [Caulobacter sp.]|nr:hypothetical protein [Caulobacter sp.]
MDKSAAAFLERLATSAPAADQAPTPKAAPASSAVRGQPFPSQVARAHLKHIGGYLDRATQERVVLLKTRLKLDNSELLKRAIDSLWADEEARRVFSDG